MTSSVSATSPQDIEQEEYSIKQIIGLIIRHGQCLLVYPSAFEKRRCPYIRTPSQIGIPYIAPLLRTSDGVQLSCFLLPQTASSLSDFGNPPRSPRSYRSSSSRSNEIKDERVQLTPAAGEANATVIVFHGNAAHNWEDMESAEDFFRLGCNVLLASYRGYSLSSGTPSERGIRIDAQATLDFVLDDPYLSKTPIVLYGHSLGGAVAVDLASRNRSAISALILSNTFTSIPDIVRLWPGILGSCSFLCTQRWNSAAKIGRIPARTPVLMLSGREDEVVPAELMDKLWEVAKSRRGKSGGGLWRGIGIESVFGRSWRKREGREQEGDQDGNGEGWGLIGCSCSPVWWLCRGSVPAGEVEEPTQRKKVEGEDAGEPARDVFEKFEKGKHCDTPNIREYWHAVAKFIDNVPDGAGVVAARSRADRRLPRPISLWKGRKTKVDDDVRWQFAEGKLVVISNEDEDGPPLMSGMT